MNPMLKKYINDLKLEIALKKAGVDEERLLERDELLIAHGLYENRGEQVKVYAPDDMSERERERLGYVNTEFVGDERRYYRTVVEGQKAIEVSDEEYAELIRLLCDKMALSREDEAMNEPIFEVFDDKTIAFLLRIFVLICWMIAGAMAGLSAAMWNSDAALFCGFELSDCIILGVICLLMGIAFLGIARIFIKVRKLECRFSRRRTEADPE